MNEDQILEEILSTTPLSEEPSPELMRELRVMASKTLIKPVSKWPARLTMLGTFAAVAAVVVFVMTPQKAAARTFDSIVSAASQARTFMFSLVSTESGQNHRVKFAGANGKFGLMADDGVVLQINAGQLSVYEPEKNEVTVLKFGGMVDPKDLIQGMESGISEAMKEVDLKEILRGYEQKYGKDNIQLSPIRTENGEDVFDVRLRKPGDDERVFITVRADGNLPKHMEVEKLQADGSWNLNLTMDMSFGEGVDESILSPDIPSGAKRTEIDLGNMIGEGLKGLSGKGPGGFKGFDPKAFKDLEKLGDSFDKDHITKINPKIKIKL